MYGAGINIGAVENLQHVVDESMIMTADIGHAGDLGVVVLSVFQWKLRTMMCTLECNNNALSKCVQMRISAAFEQCMNLVLNM